MKRHVTSYVRDDAMTTLSKVRRRTEIGPCGLSEPICLDYNGLGDGACPTPDL